jgi:hypothetical protein
MKNFIWFLIALYGPIFLTIILIKEVIFKYIAS